MKANAKIGRDANGNKTVKITKPGWKGFSIQTNGNLPIAHRTNIPNTKEIMAYIREHGTFNQQQIVFY